MTYAALEESRYGGQPVECYRFIGAGQSWFTTSADRQVVLPWGTFEPETITRTEMDFSQEDSGGNLEIRVPRTNPVAALFIGELPSGSISVSVYRAHRSSLAEAITIFVGAVSKVRFEESEAVLVCSSITALLNRPVPTLLIQSVCNHVLYSAGCGANPTTSKESVLVTTVNGVMVTSNDFAVHPDQWFRGGRLVTPDGETRFIADHVGDTVTLISALPGLISLMTVDAYWGCDHLEATCTAKFDNLDNFLGWARLPQRNPFVGRID